MARRRRDYTLNSRLVNPTQPHRTLSSDERTLYTPSDVLAAVASGRRATSRSYINRLNNPSLGVFAFNMDKCIRLNWE